MRRAMPCCGCAQDVLSDNGLFYVNYNAFPGWKIRGMVRRLLLMQTRELANLPRTGALGAQDRGRDG